MADRSGVEIDYCPQCRGVWLDRGELDKIIERSAGVQPPPPPQRQADRGRVQGYDPSRKKKSKSRSAMSFLDDIFDF
jgi:Zn-finger nucleic acid-binding protein